MTVIYTKYSRARARAHRIYAFTYYCLCTRDHIY